MRKILESRDELLKGLAGQGDLMTEFAKVQRAGKYSNQKMYTYLMPIFPRVEWKSIMLQQGVHPRFKFIMWLAVQNRLATVDRLDKIGIKVPPDCAFCGGTKETFDHLYFECQETKTLWSRLCNWLGIQRSIDEWRKELTWISTIAKKTAGQTEIVTSAFVMTVYVIWRERNRIRFQQGRMCKDQVLREIVMHLHIRGQHKKKWQPILQNLNQYP